MKEVEIKNEQGDVISKMMVNEESDYAQMYREAKDKVSQMKECIRVLSEIIEQQEKTQASCAVNLLPVLAVLDYCDRESSSLLLKPMAKACRKALHRNEVAMGNYYKMAKKLIDEEENEPQC